MDERQLYTEAAPRRAARAGMQRAARTLREKNERKELVR